ncbi:MAG: histidinol dehydrogenase [Deltaproteobacteria bacterium CG_4_8_14_3_um_filter_51_11]|nr:histidinol dehydrogenase [bacterium]OIP38377.1 MAG: histidinol dehydrogenase [Desulfobacteraceae bacterium CG2_30_51_40]PIP46035.1 MAG: histidinol dehydrogenase [Deltaproteobacteria bacterium CG23_combo_of_CG06-09_8_20_14_all_51_20]PIX19838.1 MAG: histidinol dehydrogenase [Deltaproteobacteria bacterium CG_4_8_14_3_um_filter_51_11]PJB34863.1 MAG: histidinol dehydrogenase [Deltaproteobacteria bacterium CG_4_9_14_3_um_filter_51_14]
MIIEPKRIAELDSKELEAIMNRSMDDISSVYEHVRDIVMDVKLGKDEVLLKMSGEFKTDVSIADLEVDAREIRNAYDEVSPEVVEALKTAARNISFFHRAQKEREMWSVEIREGIMAGRLTRPIDRVGCYIPGGRAAYPSTILMTVIPAREAGVLDIVATTPAGKDMTVNPVTLVAADIAGCDRVFKVGGPWGIAAMAFGTGTIPRVDKIVGPGNKYVTAAKMIVYGQVDIDSPAGPSEALILADESANAGFIAADFLSQAEHDPDSAAVLVTTSSDIASQVCALIEREYPDLPRKEIFNSSLSRHSWVLIADNIDEAIDFTNDFASEHLQIMTEDPFMTLNRIRHAGSIFLGPYSPVPAGDYASGTNHVLPTGRCARMFSGLSMDDFIKKPTFQYLSKSGLAHLKNTVVTLAEAEGLPMHARAVKARFVQRT